MTHKLYICIVQEEEWSFKWDLVCGLHLTQYITENSGCYVEPFDEGKIGISHKLTQEVFFTSFNPPEYGDAPDHNWLYTDYVKVYRGSEIQEAGGERLVWVKLAGCWVAFDYDDYEDFIQHYNEDDATLFDHYNIQKRVI